MGVIGSIPWKDFRVKRLEACFASNLESMTIMTQQQVLDLYFMDARHKLIDLAAFMDRVDRGEGDPDFRYEAFRKALEVLSIGDAGKAAAVLNVFSDPTMEPIEAATTKAACGAWPGEGNQ
jgi:hypothetical protein